MRERKTKNLWHIADITWVIIISHHALTDIPHLPESSKVSRRTLGAERERQGNQSKYAHTNADGWQTFPIYAIIDKLWQANEIE